MKFTVELDAQEVIGLHSAISKPDKNGHTHFKYATQLEGMMAVEAFHALGYHIVKKGWFEWQLPEGEDFAEGVHEYEIVIDQAYE